MYLFYGDYGPHLYPHSFFNNPIQSMPDAVGSTWTINALDFMNIVLMKCFFVAWGCVKREMRTCRMMVHIAFLNIITPFGKFW